MVQYLRDRIYKLVLGDASTGDAISITELEIRFEITKFADNKRGKNTGSIEVFNLSDATIAALEVDYLYCEFYVGYYDTGLVKLISGNVVECRTMNRGVDTVTQIIMGEGFSQLNLEKLSDFVAPGDTKRDVIAKIASKMPNVTVGACAGPHLDDPMPYGYPLTGTPQQMLNELCEADRLEWRINNDTLNISEENGLSSPDTSTATYLSESTGLLDIPFKTSGEGVRIKKDKTRKQGIQFKALCNASIMPGSIVNIVSKKINGYYRISSIRYSGDYEGMEWYIDAFCNIILEDELK